MTCEGQWGRTLLDEFFKFLRVVILPWGRKQHLLVNGMLLLEKKETFIIFQLYRCIIDKYKWSHFRYNLTF